MDYKITSVELVINEKDWPQTLENFRDYLETLLGVKWSPLAYSVRTDVEAHRAAEYPAAGYLMVGQDNIHHAPHSGPAFRNYRRTVWDVMSNIC
jgi:hypothetical protein